jgi:hypothetical protein
VIAPFDTEYTTSPSDCCKGKKEVHAVQSKEQQVWFFPGTKANIVLMLATPACTTDKRFQLGLPKLCTKAAAHYSDQDAVDAY